MPTLYRVTATLNKVSQVPVDAVQNVWHVNDPTDAVSLNTVAIGFEAFYQALEDVLAPSLSGATEAHSISLAEVSMGSFGPGDDVVTAPVYTDEFTLTAPGAAFSSFPNEVAACLSFAGELEGVPEETGTTRPASRRRGRVYLGPLSTGCTVQDGSTGEVYLYSGFINDCLDALEVLVGHLDTAGAELVVYSRASALVWPVVTGWMDNAPDTVRSRGTVASTRSSRTF